MNRNFLFSLIATSVATQSDDSIELDEDIGLNRNHLSKDLQDVYDTLMNFQKRDNSTAQSYAYPVETPRSVRYSDDNEQLSEIMAHYGVKMNAETPRDEKEYFIPVDYETYNRWLQRGKEPSSFGKGPPASAPPKKVKKVPHQRPPNPSPPQLNRNEVMEEIGNQKKKFFKK